MRILYPYKYFEIKCNTNWLAPLISTCIFNSNIVFAFWNIERQERPGQQWQKQS